MYRLYVSIILIFYKKSTQYASFSHTLEVYLDPLHYHPSSMAHTHDVLDVMALLARSCHYRSVACCRDPSSGLWIDPSIPSCGVLDMLHLSWCASLSYSIDQRVMGSIWWSCRSWGRTWWKIASLIAPHARIWELHDLERITPVFVLLIFLCSC